MRVDRWCVGWGGGRRMCRPCPYHLGGVRLDLHATPVLGVACMIVNVCDCEHVWLCTRNASLPHSNSHVHLIHTHTQTTPPSIPVHPHEMPTHEQPLSAWHHQQSNPAPLAPTRGPAGPLPRPRPHGAAAGPLGGPGGCEGPPRRRPPPPGWGRGRRWGGGCGGVEGVPQGSTWQRKGPWVPLGSMQQHSQLLLLLSTQSHYLK